MTPSPVEVLLLLAVFVFVALVFALLDPLPLVTWYRRLQAWLREEMRLVAEESWSDGIYQGPGSGADPRVAQMAERQRELATRMREEGRHLLAGRVYRPVLTKPIEAPPPKAAKVFPIRKTAGVKR